MDSFLGPEFSIDLIVVFFENEVHGFLERRSPPKVSVRLLRESAPMFAVQPVSWIACKRVPPIGQTQLPQRNHTRQRWFLLEICAFLTDRPPRLEINLGGLVRGSHDPHSYNTLPRPLGRGPLNPGYCRV